MDHHPALPATATRRRHFLRAGLATALLFATQRGVIASSTRNRLAFAVIPYLPARRLVALYAPLIPVIEATLGKPVDIVSAPDYAQHLERMRSGAYDIVADSMLLARIAQREHGFLPIARTKTPLEPILVVPSDSHRISLATLKGKTIAVTDRHAALAVIGLRYLRDHGLVPERDFRIVVTHSHANSLHRLLLGETAAAIVSRTTLKQVDAGLAGQVRVLETLPVGLAAVIYHVAPHLAPFAATLAAQLIGFAASSPAGPAFIAALGHEGLLPVKEAEMKALDPLVVEYYRQI